MMVVTGSTIGRPEIGQSRSSATDTDTSQPVMVISAASMLEYASRDASTLAEWSNASRSERNSSAAFWFRASSPFGSGGR